MSGGGSAIEVSALDYKAQVINDPYGSHVPSQSINNQLQGRSRWRGLQRLGGKNTRDVVAEILV